MKVTDFKEFEDYKIKFLSFDDDYQFDSEHNIKLAYFDAYNKLVVIAKIERKIEETLRIDANNILSLPEKESIVKFFEKGKFFDIQVINIDEENKKVFLSKHINYWLKKNGS